MKLFIANMPSLICVIIAGTMAIMSIPAWGWFLFAAMLLTATNK